MTADVIQKLSNPIRGTWNDIAGDAMELVENNEQALEMVLDANRMTMSGYPEADKLLSELLADNSFTDVISALSEKIRLY